MSEDPINYTKSSHAVTLPTADPDHFFIVDKKSILGKGKFGTVYQGRHYDTKNNVWGETVAVKEFDLKLTAKERIQKEVDNLRKSFETEEAVFFDEKGLGYIVTEYVPGTDLGTIRPSTRTPVAETVCDLLPFEQRVQLLWYLMLKVNDLHHNTKNKWGGVASAMVHLDVKLSNIRVNIQNKQVKGVELIDRGISEKIDDEPWAQFFTPYRGTQFFVSPELCKKEKIGRKTDIRSLVPVILSVLGVEHPFQLSYSPWCEFDISALYSLRDIPCEIKPLLATFLTRMSDEKYDLRPDTEECLKFITGLRNYVFADSKGKAEMLKNLTEKTQNNPRIEVESSGLRLVAQRG